MTRMGSARFEGDTWDLASSVGVTATMVAAARAVATRNPDPLINDQFAEPLVRAVGVDFFTRMASGGLDPRDLDDDAAKGLRRFADAMAIRTEYFDNFFLDATGAGIRQAVILASGLDSRAHRLAWPAGTTVFEVDQPQVIEFKTATLAALGAQPTADRRPVAIDLRNDWPTALKAAGFDPGQPTAWIAEGLLGYLTADAQDRLLDQVTALSCAAAVSPRRACWTSTTSTKKNSGGACSGNPSGGATTVSTSIWPAWCISTTAPTRRPISPAAAGRPLPRAPRICWPNTGCRRSTPTTPRSAMSSISAPS